MESGVLVAGAGGQLGREMLQLVAPGDKCIALGRRELDISDPDAVRRCLREYEPEILVNAAAYTAVDQAESEPTLAHSANAEGPRNLAVACGEHGVRLIHISTDFVFDGESNRPYLPEASTAPLGEYGRSKLAGELAVLEALPGALIFRTGWVYSCYGGNFVKTMLRLFAQRDSLNVVADQIGTPTWARGLAQAVWAGVRLPSLEGIYHWSDAGVCSWYDFAVAIEEEGRALGLLQKPVKICPIAAQSYPTPARRPAYSVLNKDRSWQDLELEPSHWRVQLRAMLRQLKEQENE